MTNAIQIIKLVLSLLPAIIEAVRAIEAAFPASGQGASKLALIRETLQSAWSVGNDMAVGFDAAWKAIEPTVGAVVGLFNKTGAFKSGA